ncbi:hypothetical protein ACS0TY_004867 [Phlomoides rotata]
MTKDIHYLVRGIIERRLKAIERGEVVRNDDLLGILMDTNSRFIKEENARMSIDVVIEECKLFYLAGSDTIARAFLNSMPCSSRANTAVVREDVPEPTLPRPSNHARTFGLELGLNVLEFKAKMVP